VLAFFLFGEQFSLLGYAGSSLIIIAVLLVVLSGQQAGRTARSEG